MVNNGLELFLITSGGLAAKRDIPDFKKDVQKVREQVRSSGPGTPSVASDQTGCRCQEQGLGKEGPGRHGRPEESLAHPTTNHLST